LIEEKILVENNGITAFAKDYLFASPSAAAGLIRGSSANGWLDWKDAQGRSLRENEQPE